jgi:bifunctional ADP-heptose synthase (sugar kinase/adenylyltransferase)
MNILVIGDTAEDVFIRVDATRLSPEYPVAVVKPHSVNSNAGMAGNVLANIRSLAPEAQVALLAPKMPSVKTRYVDRKTNHNFLRVDQDAVSEPLDAALFQSALKVLPDAVVISDYGKGFLTPQVMQGIAEYAAANNIATFCDTKSLLGTWSKHLLIVKINEVELAAHTKVGIKPWEHCQHLIVTKGGAGMDLYAQDGSISYHSPGVRAEVADSVGCGDSVLAALAIRYLGRNGVKGAMDYANKVGAVAVSKRGCVAVRHDEVPPLFPYRGGENTEVLNYFALKGNIHT